MKPHGCVTKVSEIPCVVLGWEGGALPLLNVADICSADMLYICHLESAVKWAELNLLLDPFSFSNPESIKAAGLGQSLGGKDLVLCQTYYNGENQ